jgi:hypothetical protein
MKSIESKVYNYKTKYKEGFIKSEINDLLKDYPDINMDKFDEALYCITCININGEIVIYHSDIYIALINGIENRNLNCYEFD